MLCITVILICNKIKNYLQNSFTKMSKIFNWEITRLIQFLRLFIRAKNKLVKWDTNNSYMYQSLTGLQFRKT